MPKQTEYSKWSNKEYKTLEFNDPNFAAKLGWNAAVKKILRRISYRNRCFEGNWQHEDIDTVIEELREMVEK